MTKTLNYDLIPQIQNERLHYWVQALKPNGKWHDISPKFDDLDKARRSLDMAAEDGAIGCHYRIIEVRKTMQVLRSCLVTEEKS